MRIRQIKPAFFKDARIAALSPAVRLFYIGLWMLADDAGYCRWDVSEAGLELYGYESRTKRERDVTNHLAALVAAGRVTDLECGHVVIPTFTDHQRFSSPTKRFLAYEKEHLKCAPPHVTATPRGLPRFPADVRDGTGTGKGTGTELELVRNGTELSDARKREDETESDFRSRVGTPEFMGGRPS